MAVLPQRRQNVWDIDRVQNFAAVGNTTLLPCTTATANRQFPALADGSPATDVLIYNAGSVAAFITFGTDNTVATVIPVDGTSANGIPIPPGVILVLDKGFATWVSGITGSSTASVYLTQGFGS